MGFEYNYAKPLLPFRLHEIASIPQKPPEEVTQQRDTEAVAGDRTSSTSDSTDTPDRYLTSHDKLIA